MKQPQPTHFKVTLICNAYKREKKKFNMWVAVEKVLVVNQR